jgi:hypothetical protein
MIPLLIIAVAAVVAILSIWLWQVKGEAPAGPRFDDHAIDAEVRRIHRKNCPKRRMRRRHHSMTQPSTRNPEPITGTKLPHRGGPTHVAITLSPLALAEVREELAALRKLGTNAGRAFPPGSGEAI